MKKLVTVALAALLIGSLLHPATAAGKKQVVEGSILFPAPFAQGQFDGCWGGLTRRSSQPGGGEPNGVFGYVFDIDPKTWGGKFKLEPTGGDGTVDLDLFLYIHYPEFTAEEIQQDPVNGGTPVSVDYQTREAGGEAGTIPADTVKGIVCMYAGPEYQGFNSTFTYTGTPPKKKKK